MRIAQLTGSLSRRGAGVFEIVRGLAKACRSLGATVEVFGVRDHDTERDAGAWSPVWPRAFGVVGSGRMGYSWGLEGALRRFFSTDAIVHMHGIWGAPSLALYRWRRRGGRCVISPHGMLDPWALNLSKRQKQVALWLYERENLTKSCCLHATSEAELASIRRFGLRGPAVLLPNGVELPGNHDEPGPRDPAPPEWRGDRLLLFLGRLHPKKGLLPLIEAWGRVSARFPTWRLAIAGPGEGRHEQEVADLIARRGVTRTAWLVGPQYGQSKDAWLRRADAFVLPSYSEGCPMAVLEAMAYGKPVIVSPYCNFPSADMDGTGFICEPTPDALVGGLASMLGLPATERAQMGRRGRQLVEERYSWAAVAQRLLAVYRWVLGEGPTPDDVINA